MAERRGPNFEPVVDLLARLARDKVYGPLDMLSRVEDNDEFYMKMAREALYSALRYVSTEKKEPPPSGLEDSIRGTLAIIKKKPYFAKEVALRALARAMSSREKEGEEKREGQGE
jgi:hypothetical protein